jgi:hypothetical protein
MRLDVTQRQNTAALPDSYRHGPGTIKSVSMKADSRNVPRARVLPFGRKPARYASQAPPEKAARGSPTLIALTPYCIPRRHLGDDDLISYQADSLLQQKDQETEIKMKIGGRPLGVRDAFACTVS